MKDKIFTIFIFIMMSLASIVIALFLGIYGVIDYGILMCYGFHFLFYQRFGFYLMPIVLAFTLVITIRTVRFTFNEIRDMYRKTNK